MTDLERAHFLLRCKQSGCSDAEAEDFLDREIERRDAGAQTAIAAALARALTGSEDVTDRLHAALRDRFQAAAAG